MADRTPEGSALGLSVPSETPDADDPLLEGLETDAPETPEAPAPSTERYRDKEALAEGGAPDASQEAQEGPQGAVEPQTERYGEEAYKKLQGAYTRDHQALLAQQAELASQKQILESMAPYMQRMLAEQDPAFAEQLQMQQNIQPFVDQAVQPIQAQLEAQNQQMEAERIVSSFRAAHPDVAAGSEADREMAQTMSELGLRVQNPDSLEIGYEATRNPALRYMLKANPALIDTDEGMAYARFQAQTAAQQNGSPMATPTPQQQQAPAQQKAFVETGGSGAPVRAAPGARGAHDEFDEAYDSWAQEKKSLLFGGLFQG